MTKDRKKEKLNLSKRVWEIDFMRGLAILLVAFDHALFDMAYLFGEAWTSSNNIGLIKAQDFAYSFDVSALKDFWWPFFIILFFIVSGISTSFSRNNFKRGLKLAMVAVLLTVGSVFLEDYVGISGITIYFGVLHCIAASILIITLIDAILNKIPKMNRILKALIFWVLGILIVLFYNSNFSPIGSGTLESTIQTDNLFLGIFIHVEAFWRLTADYFPLVPYIGYFSLGTAIGLILYSNKQSLIPKLNGAWHLPITIPGRHSAFIYLGVRAIDIAILALITYIITGSFL
ncbi:MAG: DUF1624 domain-containing protein [Christensenellaceae bacterium]|jgi:uncharacterized membrane protein|nr:DUF1624 domain-containing protein [Christensenellaceae bacterium]